ncbi:MAG TPA: hypothetical protein VJL29_06435 [Thermoguttaceae bacterium]|nr:hypothetical protein [Thermoguttaceae bacterium]
MKKLVLSMAIVVLVAAVACPLLAQADKAVELKPVAVVSLPSYENCMADLKWLDAITDRPHLSEGVEGMLIFATGGVGIDGFDKTRPAGLYAATDGEHVGACLFLPVTDLGKLIEAVKIWDEEKVTTHDDGIYEIRGPRKTVYVQETHPGWAYVVENKDHFRHVPEDPAKLLDGLSGRYDVGARVYVANLPEECREKLVANLKKKLHKAAERHHAKRKHRHEWNPEAAEHVHQHIMKAARDLETVTLGMSLEADRKQGVLEISVTAREGTKAAEQFALLAAMKSDFAGFQLPEAAVTGRITVQCPGMPSERLDAMVERMRQHAYDHIAKKDKSEEQGAAARKVVDTVLDVVKQTAAEGRHDGAISVAAGEKAATLIAARRVADGPKLEKAVKMAVEQLRKEHPDKAEMITLDAESYHGVNLHAASLPIPEECPHHDETVQAVGEQLQIVLGIGPKAVYVAAGRDAMKSLKEALDRSEEMRESTAAPMEWVVVLGRVVEFAEEFGPPECRAKADKASDLLDKAEGRDRVRVTAVPQERGLTIRAEFDEGVLRVMNAMKRHHRPRHE